jgi:hypothetical protein
LKDETLLTTFKIMADSTKSKKNYAKGSAKQVTFANGGELINLDLKIEGKLFGSKGEILPNKAGYVKITLSKLDKTDDYGNTHSIYENDFKPEAKTAAAKPAGAIAPKPKAKATTSDDLPF